jgi:serine/threonine protein kinase
MNDCLRVEDLARLLDQADEPAGEALERHLATCSACRQRLDALCGAGSLSADRTATWRTQSNSSAALRYVIQTLQESPHHEPAAPISRSSGALAALLQPTDKPGFLGRLGSYEVRRMIGQGGMGIVLEALDPLLKRTVAIKLLSPWRTLDESTNARFLREAQSAALLAHENVVAIYGVHILDGVLYLVMEYVAGESLADRLDRQGKLPLGEVVRIGVEVSRGLAAAHDKGLIHRDIKPGNVLLVAGTDRAKIADFGLAKTTGEDAITVAGTVLGTPEFMSPEQAARGEADARSDLFSLGAVLYAAATGVSPFRHESLLGTLDQVRLCQPQPLQRLDASLPDWFCMLVHRLLSLDPQGRPQSAAEVAEFLEQRSSPASVVAPPAKPPTPAPASKPPGWDPARRWWLIAPLALILVGLIVVVGSWLRGGPSPEATKPQLPAEPPAIATGLTIVGHEQVFDDLKAALAAAQDRDLIEVHGNHAYLTPPLTVEGKRLTIRAAADSQPVFLQTPGQRAQQPFLQSDSDLRLEGLEIHWSIEAFPEISEASLLGRSVVATTHGRLVVAHCRIVSERLNCCLGGSCQSMIVRNSQLIAKTGMGVFWRPESTGQLRLESSVLENRFGVTLLVDGISAATPGEVYMSGNTLRVERAIQLLLEGPFPKTPLPMSADHNLFDCEHLFLLTRPPQARGKMGPRPDDLMGMLQTTIAWQEEGNVFRRGVDYLGRNAHMGTTVSADIASVERWLELWKISPARSIEGEIRYQDRQASSKSSPLVLETVNQPSGPIPAPLGHRRETLGPGAAYHAWRNSPDYSDWPSNKGNK